VTHVDGTARVQTLERSTAPRLYALLEAYGRRTGVPVLLNTSFNLAGEPIVNRAVEGYTTFRRSGLSLYLARGDRQVVGADMTRPSLLLGAAAARRFGLDQVQFVQTDLRRPGLAAGGFDVVYCSGVLHHTPDPRASFAGVVELARPGGLVVLGLYNAVARIPLRLRRLVARATGYRLIPFDPVLKDRQSEPERREAWLRDQYMHPEEHLHTLGEVRGWFAERGVSFIRAYPSALIGEEPGDLLEPAGDLWAPEAWLKQMSWMGSLGHEGGLFVTVGRRAA
jgi:SAM-dependent methyltransferase